MNPVVSLIGMGGGGGGGVLDRGWIPPIICGQICENRHNALKVFMYIN